MLEKSLDRVYKKFKLNFYKNILCTGENCKANLTVSESFCAELIDVMEYPTVGDLVDFLKVAQPNITYRVNSLVEKGYVVKENSQVDRRIVHLRVTEKYKEYQSMKNSYAKNIVQKTESSLNKEERQTFEKIVELMDQNLTKELEKKLSDLDKNNVEKRS